MIIGWNIFPYVAIVAVVMAAIGAFLAVVRRDRRMAAIACTSTAIIIFALFVGTLWYTLGRPPLRTMGETRLWYSLFMLIAGLFTYVRWRYNWILCFSTLMATVFIAINILKPEIHDQTLMPALQSAWFIPHVSVYMFSYALLGCATLLAIGTLIRPTLDTDEAIEQLIYGGIAFFGVGMLSGALWAKDAWGAYWSWDAKEAWAAVTWCLWLVALHLAPQLGRSKTRHRTYHVIVVVAFLALQMCWWGVNYLPSAATSVHAYN